MGDVRYALRSLGRSPGFTTVAVLTLALGIGANVALFSVIRAVMLEPLPYRDPAGVAMIWSQWSAYPKTWVSMAEYHQYREHLQSFDDLALFQSFELNITEGEAERVKASTITTNLLRVLGITPVAGRDFNDEDGIEGRDDVVMISHGLWQARYAGDPGIVGNAISISGRPRLVAGVLPRGFRLPLDFAGGEPSQVFLPLVVEPNTGAIPHAGGSHSYFAVGRLLPGVSETAANAELEAHVRRLTDQGVYGPDMGFRAFVVTAANEVAGPLRPALMVLLGAVILVLLIACANVAGLALARSEDRRHEFGVRAALGAGRTRLARQLLIESLMLGGAGAVIGVWIAWLCVQLITTTAAERLARLADASVDAPVMGFAIVLAMLASMLAGLMPAVYAARVNPHGNLREGGYGHTAGRSRHAARRGIVAGQVALAVVLVTGAGLSLRSFWNIVALDPGFDANNVLTMRLAPNAVFYPDDAAVSGYYGELLRRVRGLSGVEQAGLVRLLPIDTEMGDTCVEVERYAAPHGHCPPAEWQAASPGYFEAMGVRLAEGRMFTDGDDRDAALVAVVNEAFVRRYIPDGDALGTRIRFAFREGLPWHTIVGVVADVRHNAVTAQARPTFYRPHAQWAVPAGSPQRTMTLVVRARQEFEVLTTSIREVVQALDARVPLSRIQTMDEVLGNAVAQPRFTLQLLGAFAMLALGLAAIGIYGVVSYTVAARRRELGIRMVLGASRGAVTWLSLRDGLVNAAFGSALGLAAAYFSMRALAGLLYEVNTADPATYLGVIGLLGAAALLASWLPARRAARIDPMVALREE
jgi:putative ABC transport system permease protein